jgi:hypothetical protein
MTQRELEPWGGDLRVPSWLRRLARRPASTDTPERAREAQREALHPKESDTTVAEAIDRAIFGGFSPGHPGNRPAPRGR